MSEISIPGLNEQATALRFWKDGVRQDFSARRFWGLVAGQMAALTRLPEAAGTSILIGRTSPDAVALFLAAVAARRQPAFFPPASPLQDEAAYLTQQRESLSRIDPPVIHIFEEKTAATLARVNPDLASRVVTMSPPAIDEAGAASARAAFLARLGEAGPIFVQHSSGTTGVKKAVPITGTKLLAHYRACWGTVLRVCDATTLRIAAWLPLYHDMGLMSALLFPAINGDCVSLIDPFEWIARPGTFLEMIEADGCEIAWLPNFAFRHFAKLRPGLEQRRLGTMRVWVNCSEPCRAADSLGFEREFAAWGVAPGSVLGSYGMAEVVFAATQCPRGEQRTLEVPVDLAVGARLEHGAGRKTKRMLSCGRVMPELELAVLVDDRPVPEGVYGEFAVRGAYVFERYLGLDHAHSNFTADGWFRTGDLGVIVDGHVYAFGRLKEMIIVAGRNLFAGDVEAVANEAAGVKRGRVVAFGAESDDTGTEELIVIAEHDPGSGIAARSARAEISRRIADGFGVVPRDVRVVDERWLVKSTSGKISRDANAAKYRALRAQSGTAAA